MKAHLLTRLPGGNDFFDHAPSPADLHSVRLWNDELYIHKVMRVNYDTYDMRREQDTINPDSHADVMMLASDDSEHPFLYARVIGIYHLYASRRDRASEPKLLHVLWVRWFDLDTSAPGGFERRRLHRLHWTPLEEGAFGFVSPDEVLRACHLIPGFNLGKSNDALPGSSIARRPEDKDEDWDTHYVGM